MGAGNFATADGHWTGAIPVRYEDGMTAEDLVETARPYMTVAATKAGATITDWRVSDEPVHLGSTVIDPAARGVRIVYAEGTMT